MSYLYFVLFAAALLLNIRNKPNLEMLGLLSLALFFPTDNISNYYNWYAAVITLDCIVVYSAMRSDSLVSKSLCLVSLMLVSAHLLAYTTEVLNLYEFIAQYLEHLQLVCFIICAPSPVYYLKRKVRGWMKRFGYGC